MLPIYTVKQQKILFWTFPTKQTQSYGITEYITVENCEKLIKKL